MKQRIVVRSAVLMLVAISGVALSGCYERVVRAEGLGAQGVAVQKPYRSETKLDKAFDGNGGGSSSSSSSVATPTAPRTPR
jgi:hypothetical protein